MADERTSRRVFLGLIGVAIVLVGMVIWPFLKGLIFAAILAGALHGWQSRLAARLGDRPNVAASLLSVGVIVAILLPVTYLGVVLIRETLHLANATTALIDREGLDGIVARLPAIARPVAGEVVSRMRESGEGDGLRELGARSAAAATAALGAVSKTGAFLFQTVMMLIALFFFLVEGRRLVKWLEAVSPLRAGQTHEILLEFRAVGISVLVSTVATAGVQAGVALVGYLLTRLPAPFFLTVVTFFVALVPAVGAASVCLASALYLLAVGRPWAALFLAIWGLTVVGLSDNVVKPLLVRRGIQMHGALVFFSLLGGLAAFGAIGLLIGPLILAFFLALIRIWERDYGRPTPRDDAPLTPPAREPVPAGTGTDGG
jgi:predicted PurR-regulated permease PerM